MSHLAEINAKCELKLKVAHVNEFLIKPGKLEASCQSE